jgi:signal peptidase
MNDENKKRKSIISFVLITSLLSTILAFSGTATYLILDIFQPSVSKVANLSGNFQGLKIPKLYLVQSGSMEPTIKTGSIVVTLPSQTYTQGDIITFTKNKNAITHRVQAKLYPDGTANAPTYKTAGDANEDFDNWEVASSEIIGKVVFSVPYIGFIADFAKKPQGFILLVIIPATIIIYEEIKNITRELKNTLENPRLARIFHRRTLNSLNYDSEEKPIPKVAILIPILGTLFVIAGLASSYFFDTEKSLGNVLTASNTYDEVSPTQSLSPTLTPTVTPSPIPLTINEFLPNSEGVDSDDWIEMYSEIDIDISGYILSDETSDMAVIPNPSNIGPSTSKYFVVDVGNRLNNSGDTIFLYTPSKVSLIETVNYTGSQTEGISRGKDPDGLLPFAICTNFSQGSSNNGLCP